uniref:Uncharacterized protein n=1 Tax=Ananas comosus var. bracteatus TaxID=296719 RepID=A0A6V7Q2D2_ANACO|nr:unnamed protein product [Ananas comosus var. bracteatus]
MRTAGATSAGAAVTAVNGSPLLKAVNGSPLLNAVNHSPSLINIQATPPEPLPFLSHSPVRELLLSISRTLPHSSLSHSLRPESDAAFAADTVVAAAVAGADCTRARAPVSSELLLSVSRTLPHSSLSHSLRPESDAAVAAAVAGADCTASAVPSLLSIARTLFH